MHFFFKLSFLKVKIQNGNIFWVLLKFKCFLGLPDTPDIFFFGKQYMLGPSLCIKKK